MAAYHIDITKHDADVVVKHIREVSALLAQHGISLKARASHLHVTEQALKQYGSVPSAAGHRLITPEALDSFRDFAIRTHWASMDRSMSDWQLAEGFVGSRLIEKKWKIATSGGTETSSSFLPRAIEEADNCGGEVVGMDWSLVDGISAFSKRSWFRRARCRLVADGVDFNSLAVEHGVDRYYVGRLGIEYFPWRLNPPTGLVSRMREMLEEKLTA